MGNQKIYLGTYLVFRLPWFQKKTRGKVELTGNARAIESGREAARFIVYPPQVSSERGRRPSAHEIANGVVRGHSLH
jgi:hypothetical protein